MAVNILVNYVTGFTMEKHMQIYKGTEIKKAKTWALTINEP